MTAPPRSLGRSPRARCQVARRRCVDGDRGHSGARRNPYAAHLETTNGPFMTSFLPLAGFAIIEATNLAEAIDTCHERLAPLPMASLRYGR